MITLNLIIRNAFRHKLRTLLTVLGLVIAVMSFGLIRTVVGAWYAGVDAASSARLVTRNAISLVFPLPLAYSEKIRQTRGVVGVSWANWFGGIYQEPRNFFPQFAIDAQTYFAVVPEFRIPPEQIKAFQVDRKGAVVGRKLAQQYGWKIGDVVPLKGTIYPGTWNFTIRAIYSGKDNSVDEGQFFFHWQFLNESIKRAYPKLGDSVGIFLIAVDDPDNAPLVAARVDAVFKNGYVTVKWWPILIL